jgi:hypothetical protein
MVRRKLKTFSRAKPQRPQRRAKTKGFIVLIKNVQTFLYALCGSVRPSSWPLLENNLPGSGLSGFTIRSMFSAQLCTTFSCFCIAFFTCTVCPGARHSMDLAIPSDRLLGQVKVVADVYASSVEAKT